MTIRVSDHALLRYLERVRGFAFKRERDEIKNICAGVRDGTVIAQGCRFEIRNGNVITILPHGIPNSTKRSEVTEMVAKMKRLDAAGKSV